METLIMYVDKELALTLEKYCQVPCAEATEMKSGTSIFDEEGKFSDGYVGVIQVISCREDRCWTQGILFDPDGHEVTCDCGEGFIGEYYLGDYIIEVKEKELCHKR